MQIEQPWNRRRDLKYIFEKRQVESRLRTIFGSARTWANLLTSQVFRSGVLRYY